MGYDEFYSTYNSRNEIVVQSQCTANRFMFLLNVNETERKKTTPERLPKLIKKTHKVQSQHVYAIERQ